MRKFLIVDDEPGILKLLSAILLEEGFQVQTACNGLEALAALQQEIPGLGKSACELLGLGMQVGDFLPVRLA